MNGGKNFASSDVVRRNDSEPAKFFNKRGDYKYGVLLALILGLMIVGLSIYFIFNEYFTQDEINYDICKQSLVLRANSPEAPLTVITASTKSFPVKCKTEVINIDFENTSKSEELIAQTMRGCWSMFLEGKSQLFPGESGSRGSWCLPCARISFDEKVKDFYSREENKINVTKALQGKIPKMSITFNDYLKKAFTYAKYYGGKDIFNIEGSGWEAKIILPEKVEPSKGDILVFLQQTIIGSGKFHSNIFYFQSGQPNPNPFDLMNNEFSEGDLWTAADLCDNYVGIPA